jgi:hypothetical protein
LIAKKMLFSLSLTLKQEWLVRFCVVVFVGVIKIQNANIRIFIILIILSFTGGSGDFLIIVIIEFYVYL